jgi:hypothetical protein
MKKEKENMIFPINSLLERSSDECLSTFVKIVLSCDTYEDLKAMIEKPIAKILIDCIVECYEYNTDFPQSYLYQLYKNIILSESSKRWLKRVENVEETEEVKDERPFGRVGIIGVVGHGKSTFQTLSTIITELNNDDLKVEDEMLSNIEPRCLIIDTSVVKRIDTLEERLSNLMFLNVHEDLPFKPLFDNINYDFDMCKEKYNQKKYNVNKNTRTKIYDSKKTHMRCFHPRFC